MMTPGPRTLASGPHTPVTFLAPAPPPGGSTQLPGPPSYLLRPIQIVFTVRIVAAADCNPLSSRRGTAGTLQPVATAGKGGR